MTKWKDLFNKRQFETVHVLMQEVVNIRKNLEETGYNSDWIEAISVYLNCVINLTTERNNVETRWRYGPGTFEGIYVHILYQ